MSSFEYVSILSSIIVGFALSDMLRSLQMLLRARARVRWDWPAPLLALLVTLAIIQVWWVLYQPVTRPISIGAFLPMLVELVLLSLLASAVFPDDIPDEGIDLGRYYDENGAFIWTIFAAALLWLTGMDIAARLAAGQPLGHALVEQIVEVAILAVMTSLIFVRKRWWHALGFAILSSGPLIWISNSLG